MEVILIQLDVAWEDKEANFDRVRTLLSQNPPARKALVVLPEMFATGFSMNVATVAEEYGGVTERFLSDLAREFNVCILAGAAMKGKDGRARNKALVFSPQGELLAFYAKMRLFTPGGESDHYSPGQKTVAFQWDDCTISPFICYDLRFPELFRNAITAHKTELFVVIANFPQKRVGHWLRLLQARAIENQAYVVGVNRIGADPFYTYNGRSVIVDPQGDFLTDAGETECVVGAMLDLANLRKYRTGLPFLADI